ncbi:unnamed protein product, partial [Musa acuminata var. zebrina]
MTSLNILANYVKACTRLSRCSNIFYKPSKRVWGDQRTCLGWACAGGHEECEAALLHQDHHHHERAIPWANSCPRGRATPVLVKVVNHVRYNVTSHWHKHTPPARGGPTDQPTSPSAPFDQP